MSTRSMGFWLTGTQYLNLAECVLVKIIENGNPWVIISDGPLTIEEVEEKTRWSDHRVAIPLFFNFYHGIELWLKASLLEKGKFYGGHDILNLYNRSKKAHGNQEFINILKPFISKIEPSSVLGCFLSENSISIADFYQALKYPESASGARFSHLPLIYQTEAGLQFFKEVLECIQKLRPAARALNLQSSGAT